MMSQYPGEVFAQTAEFDSGMRLLVPRYVEMLAVLQRCPQAKLTAVDYSPRMLEFAQGKIAEADVGERVSHSPSDG